jgi:hypothetical protein
LGAVKFRHAVLSGVCAPARRAALVFATTISDNGTLEVNMLRKSILVVLLTVLVAAPVAFVKAAPVYTPNSVTDAGCVAPGNAPTTHDNCRRGENTYAAL